MIKSSLLNVVIKQLKFTRNNSILSSCLRYSEYGDPAQVLKQVEVTIDPPNANNVLIKLLASPINPADINTIQGKYPVKPPLPAVPGNECVGKVISTGEAVKNLKVGDIVIPFSTGLGTWRTHALYKEDELMKIPNNVGIIEAATVTVNPCTAYRMLKDFVTLKPGDVVIQNGANSAVGQSVFQLCRAWGLKSVGIVRNRNDIDELKTYLKHMGADEVLTEEELRVTKLFKEKLLPKPKLALNCIGGKNALEMTRHLDYQGTLVTYGGMSREPLTITTSALIFQNLNFVGFWMTRWTKENYRSGERQKMFDEIFELFTAKKMHPPAHKLIPFTNYKEALASASSLQGFMGQKLIFDFNK